MQAYSDLWKRYAPLFRAWTDLATIDRDLLQNHPQHASSMMSDALDRADRPDSSGHSIDPRAAGLAVVAMLDRFHYMREFIGQPVDDVALDTLTTMVYRALFDPNA